MSSIITILTGLIALKELLKGKKPISAVTEGDRVTVNSYDGGSVTVNYNTYKIYTSNPVVSEAIEKQFETLENDENIDNVVLLDEKESVLIKTSRPSFSSLATPNERL